MKITVQIDENCIEDEVVIRCKEFSDLTASIQRAVSEVTNRDAKLELFQQNKSFYIPVEDILFFETDDEGVCAHTLDDMFLTKYKLYELEKILPWHFIRISKSAILNVKRVYSISRNITSTSLVEFYNTPKQIYVSRAYLKPLLSRIEEMRGMK